jgi:hypothetical protein
MHLAINADLTTNLLAKHARDRSALRIDIDIYTHHCHANHQQDRQQQDQHASAQPARPAQRIGRLSWPL